MLMGYFLLFCGCILYSLLKPSVPEPVEVPNEIIIPKQALLP